MKICTLCGAEWSDETKFCPRDGSALKVAGGNESLVGGILQSYHIIKKLGEGGMGAVYLGEHVKMGRKSAIKVMTQALAHDNDAIARFNREAANAARINHVNVCAIYDFGETPDGTIFLAMEYIEGEALTDLIRREGPLDLKRAGAILEQTGNALQAAHELGIVHRDLKPDNIMIAKSRDGSDVVKVVDFGIAKAMGTEEGQNVTRTGLVVGTPEYMSPEQLSGDKLDGRSDVYSLALVFFRMITGTLPFRADSAQEVMIKRLTDDPMRLNEALQGVSFPPKLQVVMDRAMGRMPADRYTSADEFARDAVEAIATAPTTDSPQWVDTQGATVLLDTGPTDTAVTEQLKKTRLSEAKATIAMGGMVGADGSPEVSTAEQDRTPSAEAIESKPAPHTPNTRVPQAGLRTAKKKPVLAIAASVVVVGIGVGVAAVIRSGDGSGHNGPAIDTAQVAAVTPASDDDSGSRVAGQPETPTGRDQDRAGTLDPLRTVAGVPADSRPDSSERSVPTIATTSSATVDVVAISEELVELGRRIDPTETNQSRMNARNRLQGIFDMPGVPDTVRARTAQIVAESYESEDMAAACMWIDRALMLHPENDLYIRYKETFLECTL